MDRRVLGLPAARRHRRADRLPRVAGFSRARRRDRLGAADPGRPGRAADSPAPRPSAPVWKLHELDWRGRRAAAALPAVAIARDDVAEIIFTSGATAEPKGVVITHRNVLANIVPVEREILKYRKWGKPFFPLRFLNLLPLSHMFGQAMATFIPPMLPGTVDLHARLQPGGDRRADQDAARCRCSCRCRRSSTCCASTCCASRPEPPIARTEAARRAALVALPRRSIALFGLKFWAFVVGAAPLDAALEAFWGELGFVVIQGYGLTETAPIVTLNHPFGTKKGSVGKAIAGVEVKIARRRRDPRARRQRDDGLLQRRRGNRARVRGRLVPHRRHRRDRRGRPALHPRPQEGNDRHARGAERLPRGRRAGAERDSRRARFGGRRRADRIAKSACTPCWCSTRASTPTRSCARRTRSSTIIRRSAARSSGPSRSCRAPRARAN